MVSQIWNKANQNKNYNKNYCFYHCCCCCCCCCCYCYYYCYHYCHHRFRLSTAIPATRTTAVARSSAFPSRPTRPASASSLAADVPTEKLFRPTGKLAGPIRTQNRHFRRVRTLGISPARTSVAFLRLGSATEMTIVWTILTRPRTVLPPPVLRTSFTARRPPGRTAGASPSPSGATATTIVEISLVRSLLEFVQLYWPITYCSTTMAIY